MKKPKKEKIKEIKKIESIEEIFEDKIGSLNKHIESFDENLDRELKNFLLEGNVSLNQVEITPIDDLENLPKIKKDEDDDSEKIEYMVLEKSEQKYDGKPEDDSVMNPRFAMTTAEDLLKRTTEMYSSIEKIPETIRMPRAHEMREKYKDKEYKHLI